MRVELAHEIAADDRQAYRIVALVATESHFENAAAYQFMVEYISTNAHDWTFVSSTTVLELAVKEFRMRLDRVASLVNAG